MSNKTKLNYILYHGNCYDGLCSAFSFLLYYKRKNLILPTCIPLYHNYEFKRDLNMFKDKNIAILDFSLDKELLEKLLKITKSIQLIDHHIKSQDLIPYLSDSKLTDSIIDVSNTKAGCELCWNYLFPTCKIPYFLECVSKRDIWKENDDTKKINSYLHTLSFKTPEEVLNFYLEEYKNTDEVLNKYREIGSILLKDVQKKIENSLKHVTTAVFTVVSKDSEKKKSYIVGMSNCDTNLRSEVGNSICELVDDKDNYLYDFGVIYNYNFEKDEFWLSFRGMDGRENKENVDLNYICKNLGGGGHACSSGATVKNMNDHFKRI
jgi:oligoribonuclease NrnB/cAMP/cGMP phosphodiesterase (DHH superfamily)